MCSLYSFRSREQSGQMSAISGGKDRRQQQGRDKGHGGNSGGGSSSGRSQRLSRGHQAKVPRKQRRQRQRQWIQSGVQEEKGEATRHDTTCVIDRFVTGCVPLPRWPLFYGHIDFSFKKKQTFEIIYVLYFVLTVRPVLCHRHRRHQRQEDICRLTGPFVVYPPPPPQESCPSPHQEGDIRDSEEGHPRPHDLCSGGGRGGV